MTASHNPPSIIDSFCRFEQSKPNDLFLSEPVNLVYQNFSWQSAGEEIRKMVSAIHSMGLQKGDKIAILSKNCAYWVMADMAIMMAGCVSVPLYPNISPNQLNEILLHSDSKLIFLGKLDDPEKMRNAVPNHMIQICFPFYPIALCKTWTDITKEQEPIIGKPQIDVDALACIIYTSGTTGQPKGVMHTYRAMNFAVAAFLKANPTIQTEIFFSYLPLCHVAEKMLVECGTLFTGSSMYFIESMERFSTNLRDTQPTMFLAVPRIWEKMQEEMLKKMPQKKLNRILSIPLVSTIFKKIIRKKLGLSKAHFIFTGASPINKALLIWYSKLGITILEAYGMTENLALSHANRKNATSFGTVGTPYPEVSVRIAGDQEIQIKSAASMLGYYKEPELSAACFEDGYLKTGDQGSIDSEGFLTITGRIKDQFKTSKGKYISPAPIESQLLTNSYIDQACVVGHAMPHALAICILSESARNLDKIQISNDLSAFLKSVNAELEHHERIAKLVLIAEEWTIENAILTPTLKIKRKTIDERYQSNYINWSNSPELVIFSD
ncbi:MAG: AMP-binding protein [Bacteroidota bacterium]